MAGLPTDFGHFAYIAGRTAKILAHNVNLSTYARAAIYGQRPVFLPSKSHKITIDIKSGVRTVDTTEIGRPVTIAPAPIVRAPKQPRKVENLRFADAVCKAWEISYAELMARDRSRRLAFPRFACFRFLSSLGWSTNQIGRAFKRDHTTVMMGLLRAQWLHKHDLGWHRRYEAALAELKGEPAP